MKEPPIAYCKGSLCAATLQRSKFYTTHPYRNRGNPASNPIRAPPILAIRLIR